MTTLREAAQQALEALEELNGWQSLAPPLASQAGRQAAINLRAALEQPEQEPLFVVECGKLRPLRPALLNDGDKLYTHPPRREVEQAERERLARLAESQEDDAGYHSLSAAEIRAGRIGA